MTTSSPPSSESSPRKRDPQATRQVLLQTAERLFVEKGYDGARIDEIAHEARTNKRMIYAYFGSKEQIYREVLRSNLELLLQATQGAVDATLNPVQQAEAIIRRYFCFVADHPSVVRLLAWEGLQAGRQSGEVLSELLSAGLEDLHAVLQRGVETGYFQANLDVRKLVISVNALCMGYFSRRALVQSLWEQDITDPAFQNELLQHIMSLVLMGIVDNKHREGSQAE